MVCGPPAKGELAPAPPAGGPPMPAGNGDCCHVMVVVNSHRPGFLVCAVAKTVIVKRQPTNVIQPRVPRMLPPVWPRQCHPRTFTLRQRLSGGEVKSGRQVMDQLRPRSTGQS